MRHYISVWKTTTKTFQSKQERNIYSLLKEPAGCTSRSFPEPDLILIPKARERKNYAPNQENEFQMPNQGREKIRSFFSPQIKTFLFSVSQPRKRFFSSLVKKKKCWNSNEGILQHPYSVQMSLRLTTHLSVLIYGIKISQTTLSNK